MTAPTPNSNTKPPSHSPKSRPDQRLDSNRSIRYAGLNCELGGSRLGRSSLFYWVVAPTSWIGGYLLVDYPAAVWVMTQPPFSIARITTGAPF